MPFQLKEDRSLRAIINQCIKLLEWSPIDVISKEKFDLSEFLITHKIYSIERIIAPKLSRREFMVYADEIKNLMKKKIVALEKDKSRLKEDKVKAFLLCKTFAWEMEHRYNANNVFSLGNDFQWRIYDGTTFVDIPFSNIDISTHHRFVAEEFALRMYFFQWVRVRFESALFELDVQELPDPLVKWKEKGAKCNSIDISSLFIILSFNNTYCSNAILATGE